MSQEKETKVIARKGEDVKIECPIVGNPTPIIEWRKGGDIIDYSWIRIRTTKKAMKIRKVVLEDTGAPHETGEPRGAGGGGRRRRGAGGREGTRGGERGCATEEAGAAGVEGRRGGGTGGPEEDANAGG